ncbi:hypothetical protein RFI_37479, partial [Reticulomyxa filosa]
KKKKKKDKDRAIHGPKLNEKKKENNDKKQPTRDISGTSPEHSKENDQNKDNEEEEEGKENKESKEVRTKTKEWLAYLLEQYKTPLSNECSICPSLEFGTRANNGVCKAKTVVTQCHLSNDTHNSDVTCVKFDPTDGRLLVTRGGLNDNSLKVWDLHNFKMPVKSFDYLQNNFDCTN